MLTNGLLCLGYKNNSVNPKYCGKLIKNSSAQKEIVLYYEVQHSTTNNLSQPWPWPSTIYMFVLINENGPQSVCVEKKYISLLSYQQTNKNCLRKRQTMTNLKY